MVLINLVTSTASFAASPDLFSIDDFDTYFYCEGWPGPGVWIGIFVGNSQNVASRGFWVDVFQDLPAAPVPGQLSDNYEWVTGIGARNSASWSDWVYFQLDAEDGWSGWVDVSIDSTRAISETNEGNNIMSKFIVVDC
ncbi:MAG: hypothetical protein ABMA64_34945 [Myxococcota bacterium]